MRKMDSNRRLNRQRRNSVITSRTALRIVCAVLIITASGPGLIMRQPRAEVVTDGTVGAAQTLGGPDFDIPQSLGSTQGTNLFHSFQNFNIANTESATFTGANTLQNVINRVTGDQSSTINGLLRSEIGQAAFYFINPAGVVFGADAVVDVPGDFHVSTADEVRFSDGNTFSAVQPEGSALSMATPAEFGFLGDQSSAIRVEQSEINFAADTTASLSGGQLVVDSGVLINEGGEIRLTAVGAGDTALPIGAEPIDNAAGSLEITDSQIETSGNGAGRIVINAGDTEINSSNVFADNSGADAPGLNAGITIAVRSLQVDEFASVTSDALDSGNAGDVDVSVTEALNILNGGEIASNTFNEGGAGSLTVQASNLTIDGPDASLSSSAMTTAGVSGAGGTIDILVADTLNIANGGLIDTRTFGDGNAGQITIQTHDLTISGRDNLSGLDEIELTGIFSGSASEFFQGDIGPSSFGDAGSIDVSVTDTLNILKGGQISSETLTDGNSGAINVHASNLTIESQGRTSTGIFIGTDTGILSGTDLDSRGDGGSLNVSVTDTLNIFNTGRIDSSSEGGGSAGAITVEAGNLTLTEFSNITASVFDEVFSGLPGKIDVSVINTLRILDGGSIESDTFTTTDAGPIRIETDTLIIDGRDSEFGAGISSSAQDIETFANAGSIDILVNGSLDIVNGGSIRTGTIADGNAGTITIRAEALTIDAKESVRGPRPTGIFSDADRIDDFDPAFDLEPTGNAGDINIAITDALNIINGGLISSDTSSEGNAGAITVQAGKLSIDGPLSAISSEANRTSLGQVGSIVLNTGTLLISNGGLISIESLPSVDAETLATIQPTAITISADNVTLIDSSISTASSGNVPAGSISITAADRLFLDPSSITTAANNADGGGITLSGGSAILQDSQITTSVAGQGDGGDIELNFKNLILDTGFIQANTAGAGAQGGNIAINVDALTASGNVLLTGGNLPFTFEVGSGNNVIQAAAPDGVSGAIDITSPELNIKGDLAGLTSDLTDVDTVVQDPCSLGGTQQSGLVSGRRGGLPESAPDALAAPLDRDRLNQILSGRGVSGKQPPPHQPNGLPDASLVELAALDLDCRGR